MSLEKLRNELSREPKLIRALKASQLQLPDNLEELLVQAFGLNNAEEFLLQDRAVGNVEGNKLVLSGKTSLLSLRNISLRIEFLIDQGILQFVIRLELKEDWAWKKSFPALPDSPLEGLILQHPTFLMTTRDIPAYAWSEDYSIRPLKAGLTVAALLAWSGALRPALRLLEKPEELFLHVHLDTPLLLEGQLPEIDWSQNLNAMLVRIPGLDWSMPSIRIFTDWDPVNAIKKISIVLGAEVTLSGGKSIQIQAAFVEERIQFRHSAESEPLEPMQVFSLVGGRHWFGKIDPDLLWRFQRVVLSDLLIDISLSDLSIKGIALRARSSERWTVLGLQISPVVAWCMGSVCPGGGEDLKIKGTVQASDLEFEWKNGKLTGEQKFGEGEHLDEILSKFNLPLHLPLNFKASKLTFEVNDASGDDFFLSVTGGALDLGEGIPFQLKDLSFGWRGFTFRGQKKSSVAILGKAQLGEVAIQVSTHYDNGIWSDICGEYSTEVNLRKWVSELLKSGENKWLPDRTPAEIQLCCPTNLSKYTLELGFPWELRGNLPHLDGYAYLVLTNQPKLQATIKLNARLKGIGAEVTLSHVLGEDVFTFSWEGVDIKYTPGQDTLSCNMVWSVKVLLSKFMKMTGNPYFQLPEPFDQLLDFELQAAITFDLKNKEISAAADLNQSILGVRFKQIWVTKQPALNETEVDKVCLKLETDGFGDIEWDLNDPKKKPRELPGFSKFFDLKWLALGQRVVLSNEQPYEHIKEAICDLKNAFVQPPHQAAGSPLKYDPKSNWLIGSDFRLLQLAAQTYFLNMQFLFIDPSLYGLRIRLDGELAELFEGLELEVMYQKKGALGVYSGEIVLPDTMRYMEFGAMTITLPVFAFKLYTNGDFEIDIGFPHNLDFSRSLTIQVPPYYSGSGGFYLAKLSHGNISDRMPCSDKEKVRFGKTLQFGLGLALGIGREFNKGPLKAGFSICAVGIFEGILSEYTLVDSNNHGRYFKLSALVGIIGRLYGSIAFPLIHADVNLAIDIAAVTQLESFQDLLIKLYAAVKIEASVKVNLKIKKITVNYSFSTHLDEKFSLGGGSRPPWEGCTGFAPHALPALCDHVHVREPDWDDAVRNVPPRKEDIQIYFVPHLMADQDPVSNHIRAGYCAMLYIQGEEFRKVAACLLQAVLQAFGWPGGSDMIRREVLCGAYDWFYNEKRNLTHYITYRDIRKVLMANLNLKLKLHEDSDETDDAAVFPMLPELILSYPEPDNFVEEAVVSFGESDACVDGYFDKVREHFEPLKVEVDPGESKGKPPKEGSHILVTSYTAHVVEDYVAAVMKKLLQHVMEGVGKDTLEILWSQLDKLLYDNGHYQAAKKLVTYLMMNGLRLPDPSVMAQPQELDCLGGATRSIYELTGQQVMLPDPLPDPYGIKLSKKVGTDWITLEPPADCEADHLCESVVENQIKPLLAEVSQGIYLEKADVQPMPKKKRKPRTYPLDLSIEVIGAASPDVGLAQIRPLPNSVLRQLARGRNSRWVLSRTFKDSNGCDVRETIPAEKYRAGTLLTFSIRKLPKTDPETGIDNALYSYELLGTDQTGTTLLERLIESKILPSQVYVLYPEGVERPVSSWRFQPHAQTYVVKANLSTETNPQQFLVAPDITDLVQWLWQCSIVRTGRFYFAYEPAPGEDHLPDHIFNEEGTGLLTLLLGFSDNALTPYTNCICGSTAEDFPFYLTECYDLSYQVKEKDTLQGVSELLGAPLLELAAVLADKELSPSIMLTTNGASMDIRTTNGQTLYGLALDYQIPLEQLAWLNRDVEQLYPVGMEVVLRDEVKEKVAVMPPGHIGFQIHREEREDPENPSYLDQFRHIGYWLESNENFSASCEGTPVPAQTPDECQLASVWQYQQVIPVWKHAIRRPGWSENNPYAGIGTEALVRFGWRDLFGNRLKLPYGLSVFVGCTDRLIALDQWPGMTAQYFFRPMETEADWKHHRSKLVLRFVFNSSRYEGGMKGKERACADLGVYTRLYYQLHQRNKQGLPALTFHIQTSMDPESDRIALDGAQVEELKEMIWNILEWLRIKSGDDCREPSIESGWSVSRFETWKEKELEWTVKDSNPSDIYELNVSFRMERPMELIDYEFRDERSVSSVETCLAPRSVPPAGLRETHQHQTIKWFADEFERIHHYKDNELKIAVGETRFGGTGTDSSKIWVVRMSTSCNTEKPHRGIHCSPWGEVTGYALVPLSRELISREVNVIDYSLKENPSNSGMYRKHVDRVDMDRLAHKCFMQMEEILSSSLAVRLYKHVPGCYRETLDVKKVLAGSIAEQMDAVLKDTGNDAMKASSVDKLKQQLLNHLKNAYDIETVISVMTRVECNLPGAGILPARLYGQIVTSDGSLPRVEEQHNPTAAEAFSTSIGKIDLLPSGDAPLTFTFNAHKAEYRSFYERKLAYKIMYIEHEIDQVEGIEGYEASSWLRFINPPKEIPLSEKAVSIPVPLRAYPEEPVLHCQTGIPRVRGVENNEGMETTIEKAIKWNYQYEFSRSHAAQDIHSSVVKFNLGKGERPLMEEDDLFDMLVRFEHQFPAIKQAIADQLVKPDQEVDKSKLEDGMTAFLQAMKNIQAKWKDWFDKQSSCQTLHHSAWTSVQEYRFELREEEGFDDFGKSVFQMKLVPLQSANLIVVPKVWVGDYISETIEQSEYSTPSQVCFRYYKVEDGQRRYLTFDEGKAIRERRISFEDMNVIEFQNAWSAVKVSRNQVLIPSRITNCRFVYDTPYIWFPEKLTPLLDIQAKIRIARLNRIHHTRKAQLEEHLRHLFEEMFKGYDKSPGGIVKTETRHSYPHERYSEQRIDLPVSLILPREYRITIPEADSAMQAAVDEEYLNNLGQAVKAWKIQHRPPQGEYRFDVSVFSNLNETKLPLLRLRNLLLEEKEIDMD